LVSLTAGCATDPKIIHQTYSEKVTTLLISQDMKQLVILGERYHYVFDTPPDVVKLVGSSIKLKTTAAFSPFKVVVDGTTTGSYRLILPANLSDAEVAEAQAIGFKQDKDGQWGFDNTITGKRYFQGNTLRNGRIREPLQHTYTVTVDAEEIPGEKQAEDLSSPVYLSSHGVMLIYFVALAPILIPLMFLSYEKRPSVPALAASKASQ
jgi:hypothetical protein